MTVTGTEADSNLLFLQYKRNHAGDATDTYDSVSVPGGLAGILRWEFSYIANNLTGFNPT